MATRAGFTTFATGLGRILAADTMGFLAAGLTVVATVGFGIETTGLLTSGFTTGFGAGATTGSGC